MLLCTSAPKEGALGVILAVASVNQALAPRVLSEVPVSGIVVFLNGSVRGMRRMQSDVEEDGLGTAGAEQILVHIPAVHVPWSAQRVFAKYPFSKLSSSHYISKMRLWHKVAYANVIVVLH